MGLSVARWSKISFIFGLGDIKAHLVWARLTRQGRLYLRLWQLGREVELPSGETKDRVYKRSVGKVGIVTGNLCLLNGFVQRISTFSLVFMTGGAFILGTRHPLKVDPYLTMEIFSDVTFQRHPRSLRKTFPGS